MPSKDTTNLIEDMKAIGYTNEQVHYTELADGRHNVETWARAFPEFLKWGWGKEVGQKNLDVNKKATALMISEPSLFLTKTVD